jgi:hypothetical protein
MEQRALTHLDGRLMVLEHECQQSGAAVRGHDSLPERLVAACYTQCRCGSRDIWFGSFNSLGS